ncbi:MAG: asparagine synthase (glutamine-hydrolyzing) [Planctomycetes bacterium]|nr:asparagine synthase (glutamine-hydrolyzing) [Planctomycetota bacterium]
MCGIAGIINDADPGLLERMARSLAHRGPDHQGIYLDPDRRMGMASRRLAIIDLAGGNQPIGDPTGRWWIVFNGECFNYRELRAGLEARGYLFSTRSDTEVVLAAFVLDGPAALQHLRGMFAFAIWDSRDKRLFLARDKTGIKPLVYGEFDGRLYFASEAKAILVDPRVPREIDLEAIDFFLTFMQFPPDRTPFRGIRTLLPGHFLRADSSGCRIERYWRTGWPASRSRMSLAEAKATALESLRESVRANLVADTEVGVLLSGGVDSSLLTALMVGEAPGRVQTFSMNVEGDHGLDERGYQEEVARRFGTEHHSVVARPSAFDDLLTVLWHFDQPCAHNLQYYMVSELAASRVKVVLAGAGGDEVFAGYERYRCLGGPAGLWRDNPGRGAWASDWFRDHGTTGPWRLANPWLRYLRRRVVFDDGTRSWLYSPEVRSSLDPGYPTRVFQDLYFAGPRADCLSRMLDLDQNLYLTTNHLTNLDRMAMAHSLEARVPYCDADFVDACARIPSEYKIRSGTKKYLLKLVAEDFLPRGFVHRPKQGFTLPMDAWFSGPLLGHLKRLLSTERVKKRGIFRPEAVEELVRRFEKTGRGVSRELWMLLVLELWATIYLDGRAVERPTGTPADIA